ncbi:WLM-domain-containing protein [Meira miltonrushii]|uniref:WLM-domain-containing protein n=1 Tax=Meira miltonrushii TaxID=1280837 RepID=A0A316V3M2_9BASI|nr:WLM-domain-containing protein [Meira miltonrushii]PWN32130.1 WLM-domain-containing protein [Meira miltonrushii]
MPVHLRLNDKDTSRNPFINFVTALPGSRHDEALRRLQQLSAMVKPLMQKEGFHINSLEEYEWNREFAGRCWNNGEVVELVLVSANGNWIPLQYVLYVFCHELAHIRHMNHIPKLHGALTRQLKELALEKQRQGYFGDGMWSAGRQLEGGGFVSGLGMRQGQQDLPEHVCGGAFNKRRLRGGGGRRRRQGTGNRKRKFQGPSLHTGAQTAPNTKGGNRRTELNVASGSGNRVDGQDWIPTASAKDSSYKQDMNSTFRKRTQSKDAREKRASAALARFAAVKVKPETSDTIKVEQRPNLSNDKKGPLDGIFGRKDVKEEEYDISESESETESEGDDTDYVGNDLPEDQHFTQGFEESSEQRKRRMQRFRDREETQDEDEWRHLLENSSPGSEMQRKGEVDTAKAISIEDDDDDDVILVEERPAKQPKTETKPVSAQTDRASNNHRGNGSSSSNQQSEAVTRPSPLPIWSECIS